MLFRRGLSILKHKLISVATKVLTERGNKQINIDKFKKELKFHIGHDENEESLRSELCHYEKLNSAEFRSWIQQLGYSWAPHRKYWELAYICQALKERNKLFDGASGLVFAVGTERLPAFFASLGCKITATDLPSDDERNKPWANTGQWSGSLDGLKNNAICSIELFSKNVTYRPVDMNAIPDDLTGYDFTWSTCSFEHCGSIDLGIKFIEEQMKCLKPGGIAIHTTEFNLTSNRHTMETPTLSIFRLKDIELICKRLTEKGYQVEPIDLYTGVHELDKYIDEPPYFSLDIVDLCKVKHLRLALDSYASTSIGLIIKK
jgi:hypothetical protein